MINGLVLKNVLDMQVLNVSNDFVLSVIKNNIVP